MTLTVEADQIISDEIAAWTDGAEYDLRVRQDAPGRFTVLEAGPALVEEAAPEVEAEAMPAPAGNKNPAIAAMLAKGRA